MMQDDSSLPSFRLSKFKIKKRKTCNRHTKTEQQIKRKKRTRDYKHRIPIPSFSPLSPEQQSPQKRLNPLLLEPTPSPKKQRSLNLGDFILHHDSDDDDPLLRSPGFGRRTETKTISKGQNKPNETADIFENKKNSETDESCRRKDGNSVVQDEKDTKQQTMAVLPESSNNILSNGRNTNKITDSEGEGPVKDERPKTLLPQESSNNDDMSARMKQQRKKKRESRKIHGGEPDTSKPGESTCSQQKKPDTTTREVGESRGSPQQATSDHVNSKTPAPQKQQPSSKPVDTINTAQQPSPNTLTAHVDHLFGDIDDQDSVTARDVYGVLEDIFSVPLDGCNKGRVRRRLKDLVRGVAKPGVDSESAIAAKLVDKQDTESQTTTLAAHESEQATEIRSREHVGARGYDLAEGSTKKRDDSLEKPQEKNERQGKGSTTDTNKSPKKGDLSNKADIKEREDPKVAQNDSAPTSVSGHDKSDTNVERNERASRSHRKDAPDENSKDESTAENGVRRKRGQPRKEKPGAEEEHAASSASTTTNSTGHNSNMTTEEAMAILVGSTATKAAPKRTRKRTKKGTCALCSTCSCSNPTNPDLGEGTIADMSKSDSQVERALLRRLQKLEKTTNWYEDKADEVRREYKRHRRAITKKQEEKLGLDNKERTFGNEDSSRFLPDAEEWDAHLQAIEAPPLESKQVVKAQSTLFANAPNFQPTLTQMLGQSSKPKGHETEEVEVVESSVVPDNEVSHSCSGEEVSMEECTSPAEGEILSDEENEVAEVTESEDSNPVVDHVHRVCWRQGERTNNRGFPMINGSPTRNGVAPVWEALTRRNDSASKGQTACEFSSPQGASTPDRNTVAPYDCLWDRLFAEDAGDGLDHLLNLFQQSPVASSPGSSSMSPRLSQGAFSPVCSSKLTPRRQRIVESMEEKILADAAKVSAIEAACPNWRENIRFALYHSNQDDVFAARDQVVASKRRLQEAKQKILESIQRQEVVLDVFEATLDASLNHMASNDLVLKEECNGTKDLVCAPRENNSVAEE